MNKYQIMSWAGIGIGLCVIGIGLYGLTREAATAGFIALCWFDLAVGSYCAIMSTKLLAMSRDD